MSTQGWSVNPDFFDTQAELVRDVETPAGDGGSTFQPKVIARPMVAIGDPQLLARSDQQGRQGTDLTRTVHAPPGTDIKPGDRLRTRDLVLTVESAADRSGLYRKILTVEEHGS